MQDNLPFRDMQSNDKLLREESGEESESSAQPESSITYIP